MALSLTQRLANGLSAIRATPNIGGAPFIGANDPRWTSFMGINVPGHTVHTPLGRIEIAKSAVWVYACIAARADAIKGIPLKLYQLTENGGRQEYTDHPIVQLLEDINPVKDTPTTIRTATEQSICIHGRYQWKKVRNKAGIVKELYGLPTQWTKIVPARVGIEKFIYDQTIMGVGRIREDLDPADVVYFRCLDFDDSMDGLGPLQVAVETTMADIGITVAQNAMSKNAARPSAVMTTLNKLNDSDYARENERVQRAYAGAVNAGKIILIDNAQDTKFQTVQLSPSEMQWIQEHNSHITDICAAFRTPPGVAGDYGSASRIANLGGMHRLFAEICVRPELVMYEDVLNWQLLWSEDWGRGQGWERENHLFLAHDIAGVSMFREDETSRSQRAVSAFSSGAKWDEVRAMHGLDPVGGTLGDTSFVASNLVPVDSLLGMAPGDEEGNVGSLGGVAEAAAVTSGNFPDTRPRTPPNVQEQKQQAQFKEPSENKALALLERKQFRKWAKKHNIKSDVFEFRVLSAEEQTDLLEEMEEQHDPVEDAVRATLEKLDTAMKEPASQPNITVTFPPMTVNNNVPVPSVEIKSPDLAPQWMVNVNPTPINVTNEVKTPDVNVTVVPSKVAVENLVQPAEVTVKNENKIEVSPTPIRVENNNKIENPAPTINFQMPVEQDETMKVKRDSDGKIDTIDKHITRKK